MIDKSLGLAAINKWGVEAQTDMVLEEMGEFISAWNHYKRGRISKREYVGEAVDAYIMLSQFRIMNEDLFEELFHEKISNIYNKINGDKDE